MSGNSDVLRIKRAKSFGGEISVPGDKSISHRAVMLAAISNGSCRVDGFLPSDDCLSTVGAVKKLGVQVDVLNEDQYGPNQLMIHGRGGKFNATSEEINCGNSGTTMRLLSGLLAGQKFTSVLIGDESLSTRPMRRIIAPLQLMGCEIKATGDKDTAPLIINGANLENIRYELPVASAQVKSAILLAGLFAKGTTTVVEPLKTRDHTEKMLDFFQVKTTCSNNEISIEGGQVLESRDITVPGDISSAAFWLVCAAAFRGSKLTVKNVGLNPTRNGILKILTRMGAYVSESIDTSGHGEEIGNISIEGGGLKGIEIGGDIVPNIIDEIPIIAVAGALAEGTTVIKDAAELRVKESDRISAVAGNLKSMGVNVRETDDGMVIRGGKQLTGAHIDSYGDHRIAMAFAVAGLFADGVTIINNADCIAVSYPSFGSHLKKLISYNKRGNEETIPVIKSLNLENDKG